MNDCRAHSEQRDDDKGPTSAGGGVGRAGGGMGSSTQQANGTPTKARGMQNAPRITQVLPQHKGAPYDVYLQCTRYILTYIVTCK